MPTVQRYDPMSMIKALSGLGSGLSNTLSAPVYSGYARPQAPPAPYISPEDQALLNKYMQQGSGTLPTPDMIPTQ